MEWIESSQPLFAKKKRGNRRKIKPLICWSFRAFKARVVGSSPSRLTISSNNLWASPSFLTPVVTVVLVGYGSNPSEILDCLIQMRGRQVCIPTQHRW